MPTLTATPFTLAFKSTVTIYQSEIRCQINENEYNMSQNPTITTDCSGSIRNTVTGSYFQPYATTVGLYNAANELLMVAKLANPFPIPSNTDVTFIVRYDM